MVRVGSNSLMLRSERSERLEAWPQARCLLPTLRDGPAGLLRVRRNSTSRPTRVSKTMTAGPLARFTVLDLTRVRAGPTAERYLAKWGATCIKVELPPAAGDTYSGGARHRPEF